MRFFVVVALSVSACITPSPGERQAPVERAVADEQPVDLSDTEDQCGASDYRNLVGANIAAVTLPADLNARILRPDTMATMDYRPERMNIEVDEDGTVVEVRCG